MCNVSAPSSLISILHPSFKNRWLMQSQSHPECQKCSLRGYSTEVPNPVAVAGEALLKVQSAILSSPSEVC